MKHPGRIQIRLIEYRIGLDQGTIDDIDAENDKEGRRGKQQLGDEYDNKEGGGGRKDTSVGSS